jgi:hypothetical protein
MAFALLLLSQRADAYPWMIKHGYTNCSGCHADPSGGELLTIYGHAISWEALSTKWGGRPAEARAEERRVARAISRAAHAKAAKKVAAEKVQLDEEPAGAKAQSKGGAKQTKAADADEDADADDGDGAKKGEDDEGEDAAEDAAEEEGDESSSSEESSGGSESSADD